MTQSAMHTSETEIPITDVQKVQTESLQLRNQQFAVGTLALTGSSLAIWFLTGLPSDRGVPGYPLIAILISWFIILGFLFYWSLNLRTLLAVASEYLKRSTVSGDHASHWEHWYFELPDQACKLNFKVNIPSQSAVVVWAFVFYGLIALLISFGNCYYYGITLNQDNPITYPSTTVFLFSLVVIFLAYLVFIFFIVYRFNASDKNLRKVIQCMPWASSGSISS